MDRRQLQIVVGVLVVVVIALGIYIWREQTRPSGVEIRIGEDGLSIQER